MAVVHLIVAVRILMSNPCLHVACDQLHALNLFVGCKHACILQLFPFVSHVAPLFVSTFSHLCRFSNFRLCAIVVVVMKLWIGNIPLQYGRQDVLDDLQAYGHEMPLELKLHSGSGRHQYGFATFAGEAPAQWLKEHGLCWRSTGKFALIRP